MTDLSRRHFLRRGAALGASLGLGGCFDELADRDNPVRATLAGANDLTYAAQRALLDHDALAREYPASAIRQPMRPNGSTSPRDPDYLNHLVSGFETWRLPVSGLVDRPESFSLADLASMPARTQITRHDCVEGWSCIAQWTGVPLRLVLDRVGARPEARFVVFRCFDTMEWSPTGPVKYYESVDLWAARHPQTILAYGMNGGPLPVANGAPLRVRIELQLGYKMAKYLQAIDVTDTLEPYGLGEGGYWEDRGYEWYAGI
ncbi:molybdopterin-dependent oxidoreductase [Salinarimonas ramus]|uniref:Molybdopterin oxidoreductase n=1 Tax=Salinarimonas ramus TaxID=690164 RepID=A0A917QKI9_9HYPH|nr:molybdopterin-dependent oxidoreductase [Salinarimonas ramus]GGK54669.1 molybdopterin oxidoreductase [Salinarimonas ramus]